MKKKTAPRTAISKVAAFVEVLAAELGTMLDEHVDDLLARARAYTVERLRADIEGEPELAVEATPPPVTRSAPSAKRTPRPASGGEVVAMADTAREPAPPMANGKVTCSKCGIAGHNARTCNRAPKSSGKTEPMPSRYDVIAKRAGSLPTPAFSTDIDE